MKKIGFIGAGNMASAMIGGIVNSKLVEPNMVIASAYSQGTLDRIDANFGINTTKDSKEVTRTSDIVIVAVKPDIYDDILEEIKDFIDDNKIIVTIAAGKSIKDIESIIGEDKKIVRTMPNTPALVNEAMSSLSINKNINKEDLEAVTEVFNSFGNTEVVPEYLIEAVIGASGSAPAYVFLFIEAIADAAVIAGMPRPQAYKFASQAVMGSAKMVLETGKHPGELKDMVCSPGGTTIEAVKRAIFYNLEHRQEVREAIKKENIRKILIIGTSKKMVNQIVERLSIGRVCKFINIQDISTKYEIEIAKQARKEGNHVIPVPAVEIKSMASGLSINSLKRLFRKGNNRNMVVLEKTIIRPTFSYIGKFYISADVIKQIIEYEVYNFGSIDRINKINIENCNNFMNIFVSININDLETIKKIEDIQQTIKKSIEKMTLVNVQKIDINIHKIKKINFLQC